MKIGIDTLALYVKEGLKELRDSSPLLQGQDESHAKTNPSALTLLRESFVSPADSLSISDLTIWYQECKQRFHDKMETEGYPLGFVGIMLKPIENQLKILIGAETFELYNPSFGM